MSKKNTISIAYYLIALLFIFIAHKFSPTNEAGFGWDIVVDVLVVIISIALLGSSLGNTASKDSSARYQVYINAAGLSGVILFLFCV